MRFIIAGGTGLIGRSLIGSLLAKGADVFVLSRNPEKHRFLLPREVSLVPWDGQSDSGWSDLIQGGEAIINLAGENISSGRWSPTRKLGIVESRIAAGRAICQAIEKAPRKPSVLLQASAVGYYGPRGDDEVMEEDRPGGDFLAEVCVKWEASTQRAEALGVRRVVARMGVVLSSEGGALPKMALPYRLFAGGPIGSGSQWLPWIHIDDEIGAMLQLIEDRSASGAYNLCAPFPLTNRDFGKAIGRAIERPSWLSLPGFALRIALGEMATVLLDGQRAVPKRLIELGYSFRFPTAEAALEDLLGST